jgi:hypothetical protein
VNFSFSFADSKQNKETNRSHVTYFQQQDNFEEVDDFASNIPCKISSGTEKLEAYSTDHGGTIYGNESENSRRYNSGLRESNLATTENEKYNNILPHKLRCNVSEDDGTNSLNNRETHKLKKQYNILPQEDNTTNNTDKQIYKFNFFHKNRSFDDENNVVSVGTKNHSGNYVSEQWRQNEHYNIYSNVTNIAPISDQDMSENITKYYKDINYDKGKHNTSPFINMRNFRHKSISKDGNDNSNFMLHRNKSAHTNIGQPSFNQTAMVSVLKKEVATRERRNVAYPQFTADRLWSSGQSGCPIWGFAQRLWQVKQYFWNKIPQLVCRLLPQRCQVFSQVKGWIQSPGHPRAYPNNLRLCYR